MSNERKHYPEVYRTFTQIGGYAKKHSDIKFAVKALTGKDIEGGKSGHPDYTVLLPPFGFFVEVKGGDNNFPLNEITEVQREWMQTFEDVSYIWLFLGTGRPTGKVQPRLSFLVPWPQWKMAEYVIEKFGLKGIPYEPHSLEHRAMGLSAHNILAGFELQWVSGQQRWHIPYRHSIWEVGNAWRDKYYRFRTSDDE